MQIIWREGNEKFRKTVKYNRETGELTNRKEHANLLAFKLAL